MPRVYIAWAAAQKPDGKADIALHLMEVTAYDSGMVELRYQVRNTRARETDDEARQVGGVDSETRTPVTCG